MNLEINNIDDLLYVPHLYKVTETLKVALTLDLFAKLGKDLIDLNELALRVNCDSNRLELILELLINLNLIDFNENRYSNSSLVLKYFTSKANIGKYILYTSDSDYKLNNIMYYLGNKSIGGCESAILQQDDELYMDAMEQGNKYVAYYLVKIVKLKDDKRLLDLGCGSGIFSSILQKFYSNLNITCYDKEDILHITKSKIMDTNNIRLMAGDFIKDKIVGDYDYILLSNVLHFYDKEQVRCILSKINKNLFYKGRLIIVDVFREKFEIMHNLYTLEWFSNGTCFLFFEELELVLKECGYFNIKRNKVPNSYYEIITAENIIKDNT